MAFNPNMNQYRGMNPGRHVRKTESQQPANTSGGKLMRLKCRFRPLQDTYLSNNEISENDADVVFICSDGSIHAHKIILASSSMFFIKLFENQLSSEITTVLVPDISTGIMRLILSLTYKDNVTMNHKEVKEVAGYLSLFGMNSKQFRCNDAKNPDSIVNLNIQVKTEPQPYPPQRQQEQMQQQRTQKYQQQIQAKLQQQQGQVIVKSPSSPNMVFISKTNQSSSKSQNPTHLMHKPTHQNQLVGQLLEGSGNGPQYKFQVQNYEHGQGQRQRGQLVQTKDPNKLQPQQIQMKQLQHLLSGGHVQEIQGNKKVVIGHQASGENLRGFRRIAPKPLSHGDGGEIDLYGGVSDQMEIQMETEDSNEEDNVTVDPESGRIMIQEWVQNVGRDNTSSLPKMSVSSGIKPTAAGSSRTSNQTQPGTSRSAASANQCLICNNIFEDDNKWHWHETHHVGLGIFKCAYCDELFSTSRKVYQHEMMEHGVTAKDNPIEAPTIPEDFQIVNGRKRKLLDSEVESNIPVGFLGQQDRLTLVRTLHGTHLRKLPATPGPAMKKRIAISDRVNLSNNFDPNNPQIGVGELEEDEIEETRKTKQIHWIHVCSKCGHGSDSTPKAQLHYNDCYPEVEVPFELSFVKYRLGFFGNIKCPLCPRRYTSSTGFKTHCSQIHGDYRRKFVHSNTDDSIICRHCRKKFKDPVDFHYHLSDGECYDAPEYNKDDDSGGRWIGNGNPGEGKDCNSPPKLKKERISSAASTSSSSSLTNLTSLTPHSSSSLQRSTRLTNRILMKSEDGEGGENKFPPVTCPVCGTPSVEKIVEHLQIEHSDLDALVSRVGNGLLRCQKCRITFALCDLLAHIDNCEGTKQFQYVNERRAAQGGSKSRVSGPTIEGTSIAIPPGIGCSPIDVIECKDLSSVETLKAAMHCGVCGKEAKKLGIIADCLRSHGINRCALCFNTYTDKTLYSAHLRQAHNGGPGRLCCPICPKTFINAGQVAGHMYSSHWLTLLRDKDIIDKNKLQPKIDKPSIETQVINIEESKNQTILDAVGLVQTGTKIISQPKDDYSNITLGSILLSSEDVYKKDKERGEREKSAIELVNDVVETTLDLDLTDVQSKMNESFGQFGQTVVPYIDPKDIDFQHHEPTLEK